MVNKDSMKYFFDSEKKIDSVAKIIYKYFKKCESVSHQSENNLIGLFYHEIQRYFATYISRENIYKSRLLNQKESSLFMKDKLRFGYRNEIPIWVLNNRDNYKRMMVNFLYKAMGVFNFPTIYLGEVSIDNLQIIKLAYKKKYRIKYFNNSKKIYISNYYEQKKITVSLLHELCSILKIDKFDEINNDFNDLLDKYVTDKEFFFDGNKKDVCIIGTPANLNNRVLSLNGFQSSSKVIGVLHSEESGLSISDTWFYDDRSFCDFLIGYGPMGNNFDQNELLFSSLKDNPPSYIESDSKICRELYSKKKNIILKNYSDLKSLNGLYVSGRIGDISTVSIEIMELIDPKDYIRWQHYLLKEFPNVHIKTHPKQKRTINYLNKEVELDNLNQIGDIIDDYDFVIIDSISTASSIILATDKPILYFNLGILNISKNLMPYFYERVHVINIENLEDFQVFKNSKTQHIQNNNITPLISLSKKSISRIQALEALL